MPAAWRLGAAEAGEISNIAWWDQFQDPVLSDLVRTALANNKDLKVATANVDQAAAQYGIVRSAQFPQVSGGASAERQRLSQTTALGSGTGRGQFNDFGVNLSASFELDIWGRLRRATESARASLLASEQGKGTVVLTVVTTVANGYIQLRALDRQLEIAQHTSQSLGEAARLQRVRFEEGAVPESDYRQAESQYREAAGAGARARAARSRSRRTSSACCSVTIPARLRADGTSTRCSSRRCPAGLPASLLERRPDIRQAEENLIAANADIGVAKAAYFPEHQPDRGARPGKRRALGSVQGSVQGLVVRRGCAATDLQRRPDPQSGRAGRSSAARGALHVREIDHQRVPGRGKRARSIGRSSDRYARSRRRTSWRCDASATWPTLRYREGATIYLEVANAEQSLFNAQLAYVTTQSQLFQSYANLYKAMGGGWVEDAERLTSSGDQRSRD